MASIMFVFESGITPYDDKGHGYSAGNSDLSKGGYSGKELLLQGMRGFLVDFHYSDFWADPGRQVSPKRGQYDD